MERAEGGGGDVVERHPAIAILGEMPERDFENAALGFGISRANFNYEDTNHWPGNVGRALGAGGDSGDYRVATAEAIAASDVVLLSTPWPATKEILDGSGRWWERF